MMVWVRVKVWVRVRVRVRCDRGEAEGRLMRVGEKCTARK